MRGSAASSGLRVARLDARLDALVPESAQVEVLADGFEWVEGPLWDARAGALLFSDVPRNAVFRWGPGADGSGAIETFLKPSGYTGSVPFTGREPGSNGLAFDAAGNLVLCQHGDRCVARLEPDGRFTVLAARYEGKRLNSPNDLTYGPDGALYFTDPHYGLPKLLDDPEKELPFQGVYRLAHDGSLTAIIRDLRAPNGLAFSPDGRTLYVSNSTEEPVWMAYPVRADGGVGPGRLFAGARDLMAQHPGAPDGLEVDALGNVFAAGPGGVHVFAPDGTRLGTVLTGGSTGNVAWGDDGSTLYIAASHRILRVRTKTVGAGPSWDAGSTRPAHRTQKKHAEDS